jgi:hypothetical protein
MLACKYVGWIYWNMVIWLHLLRTHQTFLLKKEKNQQTDKIYKIRKFLQVGSNVQNSKSKLLSNTHNINPT